MAVTFQPQNPSLRKPFWRSFLLPLFGWLVVAHGGALVLMAAIAVAVGEAAQGGVRPGLLDGAGLIHQQGFDLGQARQRGERAGL